MLSVLRTVLGIKWRSPGILPQSAEDSQPTMPNPQNCNILYDLRGVWQSPRGACVPGDPRENRPCVPRIAGAGGTVIRYRTRSRGFAGIKVLIF